MKRYDEQLRFRIRSEQEAFSDSLGKIASSVFTKKIRTALNDDRIQTQNALGEILKYYHIKPKEAPSSIEDMSELMDFYMDPYGIMNRNLRLTGDWEHHAMGPMLGRRTDDGSIVALIPLGVHRYQFYDYKRKLRIPVNSVTRKLIDSEAICFYKPFQPRKIGIKELIQYMVGQLRISDIVTLVLAAIAVTLLGLIMPKLNNYLISDVLESGSVRLLAGIGLFMLSITISTCIFSMIKSMLSSRIEVKMFVNCYSATLMRMLSLPVSFFRQYTSGELSSRVFAIEDLSDNIANMFFSTGLSALLSLAYIGEILTYAPSLVWPAVLVTAFTLGITIITIFVEARVSRKKMLAASKADGLSYQLISGVRKIRTSGAQKRAFANWGQLYAEEATLNYNPPFIMKISTVLIMAINMIGTIFIYALSIKNGVTVAEYYAFNTAFGSLTAGMLALSQVAKPIAEIKPSMEMLRPILETKPEIAGNRTVLTNLEGYIEMSNVTFGYEGNTRPLFDNLDMRIRPGEYVAIVGKSGCGKSTLLRVLLGFETPKTGTVYYDGRDIKGIEMKSLRRRIGTVTQDGKLFSGTIFSNIAVSAPDLTMDEAWEAAEIAGIADDIRRMPQQMNTLVSDGDGGISGGQRQRILIARAIAPKPKVLFFDEATSALDNVTQKKVSEALDALNSTRIVIAHRLSTIRQCDRILVLDQGKIAEDGSYDELLEKGALFADLVSRQQI